MLSYRHAFHAGNHADVLKHIVLLQVLGYMQQKDKPFLYVDTHSGAGLYDLKSEWAKKTAEYEEGIARIWNQADLPDALQLYVDEVRELNPHKRLDVYPGSPWLASRMLREQDRARLYELHSSEFSVLSENFKGIKQVRVEQVDGFKSLTAVLPPPSRRAAILIDPPYEVKNDYQTVVSAVKAAHRRFSTGVYMIWYPVVERKRIDRLEKDFIDSGMKNIQLFELGVDSDQRAGMHASGMIVINPPWQLKQTLENCLPWLQATLGVSDQAFYRVRQLVEE